MDVTKHTQRWKSTSTKRRAKLPCWAYGLVPSGEGAHPEVALGHCMKRLSLGTNRQTGLGSFWKAEADCLGAGG